MIERIGIVGGGQLGRMLTTPAIQMGFSVTVLDPTPHCPASQVGATQIVGSLTDATDITKLAAVSDVLTFEIEHINTAILENLSKQKSSIHPSPQTLSLIKDKYQQNVFLKSKNIPVADFAHVESEANIATIAENFGYPILLKSRFGGYDGRGNAVVRKKSDIQQAVKKLGSKDLYVEKYISFEKELSVIVARGRDGTVKAYPVVETIHKNNILHYVLSPAPISTTLQKKAQQLAISVVEKLTGAGVFGIEMFLTKEKKILINEIAPRVHNSGHFTIEACLTSQFAQHIRAITGLPLGETKMLPKAAVMINILGERSGKAQIPGLEKALKLPGVSIHLYGKNETRIERKMGHITVVGDNLLECLRLAKQARSLISI